MYKQIALKKIAKACDEVKIDTKTKMEVDAQRKEIEAQTEVLVVCKSGNLTIVWLNLSDQIEKLGQRRSLTGLVALHSVKMCCVDSAGAQQS